MSQILENKQMVHIASEIIALIGLTFYFNQKNKKLMNHIEDLAQRIEEQEDLLQKHENIIKKLVASVNELHGNKSQIPIKTQIPKGVIKTPKEVNHVYKAPQNILSQSSQVVDSNVRGLEQSLKNIEDDTIIMEELEDDSSEDLDSAIAEELRELIEDVEDLSLKKQQ